MVFIQCVVPSCKNTSENSRSKLFISIPKNQTIRKAWARAISVSFIPDSGRYRICEDHFNVSIFNNSYINCLKMYNIQN